MAPVLAYFATNYNLGYAVPMLVGTVVAAVSVVIALLLSPETKGKVLVAELSRGLRFPRGGLPGGCTRNDSLASRQPPRTHRVAKNFWPV